MHHSHLYNTINLFIVILLSTLTVLGPIGIAAFFDEKGYKKVAWTIGVGWMLIMLLLICYMLTGF